MKCLKEKSDAYIFMFDILAARPVKSERLLKLETV